MPTSPSPSLNLLCCDISSLSSAAGKKKATSFFYLSFRCVILIIGTSLVAQMGKNLPAMRETQVQSLGWEDPLEKGMATHSRILAWRTPWTEEPGGLPSMGSQRV